MTMLLTSTSVCVCPSQPWYLQSAEELLKSEQIKDKIGKLSLYAQFMTLNVSLCLCVFVSLFRYVFV